MDPNTVTHLIQAVEERAWFPAIGFLVTIIVAVVRQRFPEFWTKLPYRWQWLPAMLFTMLAGFAGAFASGANWQEAIAIAIYTMVLGGPLSIGAAHTVKRGANLKKKLPPASPPDETPDQVET